MYLVRKFNPIKNVYIHSTVLKILKEIIFSQNTFQKHFVCCLFVIILKEENNYLKNSLQFVLKKYVNAVCQSL